MRSLAITTLLGLAALGCGNAGGPAPAPSGSAAPRPAASASGSGSAVPAVETYGVPIGIPGDPKKVVEAVNGKHQPPHAGPRGTITGRVKMEGDPPPETKLTFQARCKDASVTYNKLFRVGLDGALADAMVAATGYQGYVPPAGPAAKVPIRGCAASKRTVVMTYGQRLEVANIDQLDPYVPFLDGAVSVAGQVAIPGGEAVKLYPQEPGRYMLRDQMPSGLLADVFVLKYATHDVTGLDGVYEIKNVPVGKVRVDVYLPVLGKGAGKEIEVKEGENKVDFTLTFDAKKDVPGAAPAASGSASAKPPVQPRGIPR